MKKETADDIKTMIINKIRNEGSRIKPVKLKDLSFTVGCNSRQVKRLISQLREYYPIVSRDTSDGGYWLATTDEELVNFIDLIYSRIQTNQQTIEKLKKFIS